MGFRGKLALVFASLLIFAVSAISVMEFERTTRLMVSNLSDTGVSLADQVFEQMRVSLSQPQADPVAALRNDPSISSSLRSAQAFSKAFGDMDQPKLEADFRAHVGDMAYNRPPPDDDD